MSDQDQPASAPPPPPVPAPPKKKGMSTGCIVALVLGIVALVFSLLVPVAVVGGRQAEGRLLRARAQMRGIEIAVKGYQTEYNRLPSAQSPPPLEDNTQGYDTSAAEGKQILEILMATDTSKNPRQVRFYDPPGTGKAGSGYTQAGGLVDTWSSKGYMIIFDYNGDGAIADPEHPGVKLSESILIYSAGRDLDFSTWKDNVTSWKP